MSLRNLINRLRRPKWVPPIGPRRADDDWQTGDLAECVDGGSAWIRLRDGCPVSYGPKRGDIMRGIGVGMSEFGFQALALEGTGEWWVAECFRKIRPLNREACKPAFADLMKRLGPKVRA